MIAHEKLHRRLLDLDYTVGTDRGNITSVTSPEGQPYDDNAHDEMVTLLQQASGAYYTSGATIIADDEFDSLRDLLELWAPNHPFLKQVGSVETSTGWKKVEHEVNVGSQEKARDEEEMREWWSDREVAIG